MVMTNEEARKARGDTDAEVRVLTSAWRAWRLSLENYPLDATLLPYLTLVRNMHPVTVTDTITGEACTLYRFEARYGDGDRWHPFLSIFENEPETASVAETFAKIRERARLGESIGPKEVEVIFYCYESGELLEALKRATDELDVAAGFVRAAGSKALASRCSEVLAMARAVLARHSKKEGE